MPLRQVCSSQQSLKPATVSVNSRNISVSGRMVDTYWAKNGPGMTYKVCYWWNRHLAIKNLVLAFLGEALGIRKLAKSKN